MSKRKRARIAKGHCGAPRRRPRKRRERSPDCTSGLVIRSRPDATQLLRTLRYALGRLSVFEARKPCAAASFSHM
jgi:hypothetical protein